MDQLETFAGLGLSLALGLLIGLQKEWQAQGDSESTGEIASGLRTFGLIGLSGGLAGLLALETSAWALAVGFAGVLVLTTVSYARHSGKREGIGMTTGTAWGWGGFAAQAKVPIPTAASTAPTAIHLPADRYASRSFEKLARSSTLV